MRRRTLLIAATLGLFATDALAWGLQTHVFFAQYALALLPLADAELRAAALRLPRLVLAGACLPDLALIGRLMGTPAFRRAHLWSTLRRVAAAPRNETEQALAIGYASHLLSDVIAHNVFVPEHERRMFRGAMVAHAMAEWAMDHRLRLLRASPLPRLCRALVPGRGFDEHLERTKETFAGLEAALRGALQDWCGSDPEGSDGDQGAEDGAGEHVARIVQAQHHP